MTQVNEIHVIGVGGGGSWLVPKLCKLHSPAQIVLWDGDLLEPRNLDRQLFSPDDLGRNKAISLAERHGCQARPQWFTATAARFSRRDWVFSCVDNNAGRRAIISTVNRDGPAAVICGNEYTDAEAYVYFRQWQGTRLDPLVRYPQLLLDNAPDPAAPVGCTGEAQIAAPQLALANDLSVILGLHLFYFWTRTPPTPENMRYAPVLNSSTLWGMHSTEAMGEL